MVREVPVCDPGPDDQIQKREGQADVPGLRIASAATGNFSIHQHRYQNAGDDPRKEADAEIQKNDVIPKMS